MKTVIYRIHYGFEFIYKSINSIHSWADRIIIVVSKEPWYKQKEITYLGEIVKIKHPENIDYHINNLKYIPKVQVVVKEYSTPKNQWGELINTYSDDLVLTMEPDMVIKDISTLSKLEEATKSTPQVICNNQCEFWRNEFWKIHLRHRPGPTMYRTPKNIITGFSNVSGSVRDSNCNDTVLNYGFCFSPELMLYKHLLAIGFSKQIGDSIPNEHWYNKWLTWTPESKNLEISLGREKNIPKAFPI